MTINRLILYIACFSIYSCTNPQSEIKFDEEFDELDLVERHNLQYRKVEGNYLSFSGMRFDSVMYELLLDEPDRFAITVEHDGPDFFGVKDEPYMTGKWIELEKGIKLRFYFTPDDFTTLFDSLNRPNDIKQYSENAVLIEHGTSSIWIHQTECVQLNAR